MKYVIFLLTICSLIGNFYNIAAGITWSDIAWVLILLISIYKYYVYEWDFDFFSKYSSVFIIIMLIAAFINGEFTNTVFINYFRNYCAGLVVYFALSNIITTKNDIHLLLICGIAFLVLFLLKCRTMMLDTFDENLATLDFSYGRNNVAFTALLFALTFEFLYYSGIVKSYILLGIFAMGLVIVLCASRFALMMLVISFIVFRIFSHKEVSRSEVIVLSLLLIAAPSIYFLLSSYVDSSFLDYNQTYLAEKVSKADDDFYEIRIVFNNIKPISEYYEKNGIIGLITGDAVSIQHSFFAHALITTGFVGLFVFIMSMVKLFNWSYQFKNEGFFLFVIIVTMYLNDFFTNARFIIGLNSIFFCTICAIIYKHILITEYEDFDISE